MIVCAGNDIGSFDQRPCSHESRLPNTSETDSAVGLVGPAIYGPRE